MVLKDAYAVYAVTNFAINMDAAAETRQGKNVADIAKVCISIVLGGGII
jgi:hypothetical protein